MWKTEMRNPNTMHIDKCETTEILRLIQAENVVAVDAVANAIPQIARACDAIEASIRAGGRLIYMGAGSSGRIGVLDAVECPPTYGVPRELVVGLIAGGYDKHIPYDVLGPEICKHVKKLFLCGATAPQIRSAVENCDMEQPEMYDCGDFESAVRAAAAAAREGDVVLMSPASASFDQFKNFMVRGEFFKKIVKEL